MVAKKSSGFVREPERDLGTDAYEHLKAAIRDGVFPSGTRLTEAEISERLGMSRTPVREALHRLEADGLVGHKPRQGLVVSRPDHRTIVELYVMRETLEGKAAGLAARHAGEEEISAMAGLVEAEPGCPRGTPLATLNGRFHRLIHLSANNRFLLRSLSVLSDTMALLPTTLGDEVRATQSHSEHQEILAAIIGRDLDRAEDGMRAHIRSAQRHRIAALAQSADTHGMAF